MFRLSRDVRFSVTPYLPEQPPGFNAYASKPTGEGLALFLELGVGLVGSVDPDTGFVINVSDIDREVRTRAVPVFIDCISNAYCKHRPILIRHIVDVLHIIRRSLADVFRPAQMESLTLQLNPFRKLSLYNKEPDMIYLSEKFEFAAMHKLWNESFSEDENLRIFGKCANPNGHGHNYLLEVTIKKEPEQTVDYCQLEKIVDETLIQLLDHKNLNVDVPYFRNINPTMENIAKFAWDTLTGKFVHAHLSCVTVWESDRTSCSYYGE
jgi:6-pyruvoyltetrahydropterin/6-carboxytetrahydropterin synthase